MVKLKKKDEEKRRFLILQELDKKKTIFQIAKEIGCGTATVARIKKSYQNYMLELNYNKIKNTERLYKSNDDWNREKTKVISNQYFNGFPLNEKTRKRKISIPYKIRLYIYKKCKDKNTGGHKGVSIEKICIASNKKFKNILNKKLSSSSISRFLRKRFKKLYSIRKRPVLTDSTISKRKNFAKYILSNNINSDMLFFTDEKRFLLKFMPNRQTNKVRLCKKTIKRMRQGDLNSMKKTEKELPSHSQGIMVAGGVCSKGVGKLIFTIGTMDTCAYNQTLDFYKKDLSFFSSNNNELIFQQDNAPCHVSKGAKEKIEQINHIDNWPPFSPDLSPIETVWSIVQAQLEGKNIKTLEQLKNEIIFIWNRIPESFCKKICDKFIEDLKIVVKTGHRVRGRKSKKDKKEKFVLNKKPLYPDKIENIVYNESCLLKIKKKEIKKIEKKTN